MNWSAFGTIISAVTLLLVIFGGVYVGGKLAQQVQDHTKDLAEHRERLDEHDRRHNNHDIELAKVKEWKDGFNAAAGVSGGQVERRS